MRMDLIHPFISAMDAVLAETVRSSPKIADLTMEEEGYRRKGTAALIALRGEIEGRVILDMEASTAAKIAALLAGGQIADRGIAGQEIACQENVEESEEIVRETVLELANMVTGNAVSLLNDRGFHFKVFPPEVHTLDQCENAGRNSEAMVLSFETPAGRVYMNIAMKYLHRRNHERIAMADS